MYESKGIDVYLLNENDNPDDVADHIGRHRVIYLIPSNDPATAAIEQKFATSFAREQRAGYYKIDALKPSQN